jgi:DNA ligase-1
MYFVTFCSHCFSIENTQSRNNKKIILYDLLKKSENVDQIYISSYLIQGIIGPSYDVKPFGISTNLLIKWISHFLNIPEIEFEQNVNSYGEIGLAYEFSNLNIKNTHETEIDKISITDLYKNLFSFIEISGEDCIKKKEKIFATILQKLSPFCAKYFIRILESSLRIGLSEKTVLEVISHLIKINFKNLERAYGFYPNLEYLIKNLNNENTNIITSPNIAIPTMPQLSDRIKKLDELKNIFPIYVQPKYDGLRIQIHFDCSKDKTFVFSRNLINMNGSFPEIENLISGICKKNNIENAIFDGEILVYNSEKNIYAEFQETSERRRKHNIVKYEKTRPTHYVIFDLIYLDNSSCADLKYSERLIKLNIILKNLNKETSTIYSTENHIAYNAKEINDIYKNYEKLKYEGIIIKNPNATYSPGDRNKDCIKWKSVQRGISHDTLDLVIIGYFSGKGRRSKNGIGAILVSIYNSENETLETIAKVGSGLSEKVWKELLINLEKNISINKPNNVLCEKITPDFWCKPKIVVSIEADSITKSEKYDAGISLRFPILKNIVYDKSISNSTKKNEIDKI